MNILQVSTLEKTGGAALSAWYLHKEYKKRGIVSWMAVERKETSDPDVFQIPNDRHRGVWARNVLRLSNLLRIYEPNLSRVPPPSLPLAWLAEPLRHWNVRQGREDFCYPGSHKILALTPEKPNIVNCHNLHGGFFDLRVLPWLSLKLPVVLTLRDEWLLTGHCAYAIDCERWKTGCGHCPDLAIYPAIRRDATAYNFRRKQQLYTASKLYIITPSQWLMDRISQSMLAPAMIEGRVIHNSIDTSVFKPGDMQQARALLDLPQDTPIALFAALGAPSSPFKDFTTIEGAVRHLLAMNKKWRLFLVCLGAEAPDRQVDDARIRFVGYVKDRTRVAMYYQAADVYLHAARAEVWGKTVTEALACGTPVVATAVGGIPEQIEDGVTGFLTPPADPVAMAARIEQLLNDDELRQRMGLQAAEVARKKFSLDRQVDEHLEWFADIVSKCQPPERED